MLFFPSMSLIWTFLFYTQRHWYPGILNSFPKDTQVGSRVYPVLFVLSEEMIAVFRTNLQQWMISNHLKNWSNTTNKLCELLWHNFNCVTPTVSSAFSQCISSPFFLSWRNMELESVPLWVKNSRKEQFIRQILRAKDARYKTRAHLHSFSVGKICS